MDLISVSRLADVMQGKLVQGVPDTLIANVSIDSRHIGSRCVFFALEGERRDGHDFTAHAVDAGANAVVVSHTWQKVIRHRSELPIIRVDDPLAALQKLAAWWRRRIAGKVIAITGSNGKTIVKDALLKTLDMCYRVAGSPGSYNSQIGVPLAMLRIPESVTFAVMEAGVSIPAEMNRLETILKPDMGILTNIGMAHISSFGNQNTIANEKLKLFRNISDHGWILIPEAARKYKAVKDSFTARTFFYGTPTDELPYIREYVFKSKGLLSTLRFPDRSTYKIFFNTPSPEILSDMDAVICAAFLLGVNSDDIVNALSGYEPSNTRMEIWQSPTGTTLINDSCSSDPISVRAALQSLKQISNPSGKKIFVFGGMRELGELAYSEHSQIGETAAQSSVDTLVLVGTKNLAATEKGYLSAKPKGTLLRFENTAELQSAFSLRLESVDTVLFKGPRNTGIDRAARQITGDIAPDRLIVDLKAVAENISRFRRKVGPKTKILGMVKALAYGSDLVRLSTGLQTIGLDCFGVSTPDEGIQLRRAGITLPILIMITTPDEVDKVIRNDLTPVVYTRDLIEKLAGAARRRNRQIDIHIKVDTGMGRLGVAPETFGSVFSAVIQSKYLNPVGLMTHFACAEDPNQDEFTRRQIAVFNDAVFTAQKMGYPHLICHAAATSGTARFSESHFDMVRIGLGLYGIYPAPVVAEHIELDLAVALVSRIAEVRVLKKGCSIGYGATFKVPHDRFRVGILPMGYNDGLPWSLSNKGHVMVNGQLVPIIGRISMDSTVIDLNDIPDARIGTDALIYGSYAGYTRRPEDVAAESGTISYELLTRLGARIQRIFICK